MAERPTGAVPRQRDMGERAGPLADRAAQGVGEMIDGELVAGRLEWLVGARRRPRAAWPGPSASSKAGTAASGVAGDEHVDRRQALIVHAPAVVQMMVDRDLHDLGASTAPACLSVPARSTQSRLRMTSAARMRLQRFGRRRDEAGRAGMQRMIGGEGGADLDVGDDARAEPLGQRDARVPGLDDRATRGRPGSPAAWRRAAARRLARSRRRRARLRPAA